jgi:hypothetical protein
LKADHKSCLHGVVVMYGSLFQPLFPTNTS